MVKTKAKQSSRNKPLEVLPVKEERTLFSWEAPERPYQRQNREFWSTVLSILVLVCLILFFVKEWFLIATLIALVFFYYVLTTIPPQKAHYRLTTRGVYFDQSQRINWDLLRRFWLDEKWGHRLIHFETWLNFPRVISLVINPKEEKKIIAVVKKYLPQEKAPPNLLEKFSSWLSRKFPLEK